MCNTSQKEKTHQPRNYQTNSKSKAHTVLPHTFYKWLESQAKPKLIAASFPFYKYTSKPHNSPVRKNKQPKFVIQVFPWLVFSITFFLQISSTLVRYSLRHLPMLLLQQL
ncbi:Uncharacterized protein TCM_024477 [Theobroma cacao]|uniref:Uncharacterized protein n=1 Tax=Theobroma cacao TaxID=3641 RepID=A0A061F3K1_THECC|nr:Uncharacterized protein TCM_024477 [Theobroma cacao]